MQEVAAKKPYLDTRDIMSLTGCAKTRAYEVIREMNQELEKMGYITFKGRVPRLYAEKRMGYTKGGEENDIAGNG